MGLIHSFGGDERWFRSIFSRKRRSHHPKVAAATTFYWREEADADGDRPLKPLPLSRPALSPAPSSGGCGSVPSPPGVGVIGMATSKEEGASTVVSDGAHAQSSTTERASSTAQESLTAALTDTNTRTLTSSFAAGTQASKTVVKGNATSAFDRNQQRIKGFAAAERDPSPRAEYVSLTNKGDDVDSVIPLDAQPKLHEERQNPSSRAGSRVGRVTTTTTVDNEAFPQHSASRMSRSESEAGASAAVVNSKNAHLDASSVTGRGYLLSKGADVVDAGKGETQGGRARGGFQNISVGMVVLYLDVCRGHKAGDGEEARRWRPAEVGAVQLVFHKRGFVGVVVCQHGLGYCGKVLECFYPLLRSRLMTGKV